MKIFTIEQRKKLLEEELIRIVEILKRDYGAEKIILFGSMVEGDMHEWSDIDLLIVKKTTKRHIERLLEASRLIKPKVGIDLFIYTPEEFETLSPPSPPKLGEKGRVRGGYFHDSRVANRP